MENVFESLMNLVHVVAGFLTFFGFLGYFSGSRSRLTPRVNWAPLLTQSVSFCRSISSFLS